MSIGEALDMGRHATYVWGSFGVTALCIVVEVIWARQQNRTIAQSVGRIVRMTMRQKNEA